MASSGKFWIGLASPSGRNSRLRYWMVMGLGLVTAKICQLVASTGDEHPFASVFLILLTMVMVGPVGFSNAAKRLHDIGRSGLWAFLGVVSFLPAWLLVKPGVPAEVSEVGLTACALYTLAFFIALGCWPGQEGPNRFDLPMARDDWEELDERLAEDEV